MMRGDRAAAGQELAGVIEKDDAVAQQAPPLLGVERDGTSRVTVAAISWGTRGIVPGHSPMGDGLAAISWLIEYLTRLDGEVTTALAAGRNLAETIATSTDPWADGLDPVLAAALARYPVPAARAQQGMLNLVRNLHRLNIMAIYRLYEAGAAGRTAG